MSKLDLRGVFPPMVTPFTDDSKQEVDEERLEEVTSFLLDKGVHGIIPCGGCGEWLALTEEEQKKIVKITVDKVNGRVPVVAGACSFATKIAVQLAKNAKEEGADAVMVWTPLPKGQLPPPTEVYEHHCRVADEANIPVMMYNGTDVYPEVVEKLVKNSKIVAIKNSTTNMSNCHDLIEICRRNVAYFQGGGECFLPALKLGGVGSITGSSNIAPGKHVELYEAFRRGDIGAAEKLHNKLTVLFSFTHPAVLKEGLRILGHPVGLARNPGRKEGIYLSDETKNGIRKALRNLGLTKS